jgi:hypothetical protein
MGATESGLPLNAWERLERAAPTLREMQPDVEALLVDRSRGRRRAAIVGVDRCYELTGRIRRVWKGLTGGTDVRGAVDRFFADI